MSKSILPQSMIDASNNVTCRKAEQLSFAKIDGKWQWTSHPIDEEAFIDLIDHLMPDYAKELVDCLKAFLATSLKNGATYKERRDVEARAAALLTKRGK